VIVPLSPIQQKTAAELLPRLSISFGPMLSAAGRSIRFQQPNEEDESGADGKKHRTGGRPREFCLAIAFEDVLFGQTLRKDQAETDQPAANDRFEQRNRNDPNVFDALDQ
jgi:hypothetical protein